MTWQDNELTVAIETANALSELSAEAHTRAVETAEVKLVGKEVAVNMGGGQTAGGKVIMVGSCAQRGIKVNFVMRKDNGEWGSFVRACRIGDIIKIVEAA